MEPNGECRYAAAHRPREGSRVACLTGYVVMQAEAIYNAFRRKRIVAEQDDVCWGAVFGPSGYGATVKYIPAYHLVWYPIVIRGVRPHTDQVGSVVWQTMHGKI